MAPFEAEVEDEAFFDEIAESRLAGAGFDAAWSAAADGDFRFLGLFLRLGRSLESRDFAGRTLLMAAAGGGQGTRNRWSVHRLGCEDPPWYLFKKK